MSRKGRISLFLAILFSTSTAFGQVSTDPVMWTDKESYQYGETIVLSTKNLDKSVVPVRILHEQTNGIIFMTPSGPNFPFEIKIEGALWETGDYKIFAGSGSRSVSVTVFVDGTNNPYLQKKETESILESTCGIGTELIDGVCQITNYNLYNTYRITHIENFPDPLKAPQHYIDRYNTESEYKIWFDSQFPDKSIEDVVSYRKTHVEGFPDNSNSPKYYVERIYLEDGYEVWFDKVFPTFQIENVLGINLKQKSKIMNSIGIDFLNTKNYNESLRLFKMAIDMDSANQDARNNLELLSEQAPNLTKTEEDIIQSIEEIQTLLNKATKSAEEGNKMAGHNYLREAIKVLENELEPLVTDPQVKEKVRSQIELVEFLLEQEEYDSGGGCLIATATYGTELSTQVQHLRELRDNILLKTNSGSTFMAGFNEFYYSFSPAIADFERSSPVFKEIVKISITPLITSLSILNFADVQSESEVLLYGISLVLLNLVMYFVFPAIVILKVRRFF